MPKLVLTFGEFEDAEIDIPLPRPEAEAFFVFGLHKCGSSMLSYIFRMVCDAVGIPDIALPERLFEKGHPDPDLIDCTNLESILSDGYCYRAFRILPPGVSESTIFRERRKILLVRDPRDAIVSAYFSFVGGSHRLPKGGELIRLMEQWRKDHRELSIGEFARRTAPNYRAKLRSYREAFEGLDNVRIYRYEDIIFEKRDWIDDMFRFLDLRVPVEVRDRIVGAVDLRPTQEDPNAHVRKVTPGDHKEKLDRETIAALNEILSDEMRQFGYVID